MAKGRKGRRGSRSSKKMMKGSCMWGGESAHYAGTGSGGESYARAIYGDRGEQVADGMGGNHIKMNDPAVAWKGGQRGGKPVASGIITFVNETASTSNPAIKVPAGTTFNIDGTNITVDDGTQPGGSMLGAAIVPAALLAANQLYKPTRAINNLSFGRKKGFKKTLKKFPRRKR